MARRQTSSRRKRTPARGLAAIKEELSRVLSRSIVEFNQAGLPFALVGGLAVGVRADPRVTRDIDFVIPAQDDQRAEEIVFALHRRGFVVEAVFVRESDRISTVRTRHKSSPDVLVDLLLSNARIEQEIVDAASSEVVTEGVRCPVAQPWHLLAMKVLANRRKDQPDLQGLVERATKSELLKAEAALRLMQERGVAPKRNLVSELRQLVREVRASGRFEKSAPKGLLKRLKAGNPRPRPQRKN